MFRLTFVARKISPFCLYVKEVHAVSTRKPTMKTISKKYRALTPAQRTALNKRASGYTNHFGGKYAAFVKKHKGSFKSLSPQRRQQKIGELWRKERARLERVSGKKKPSKTAARRKVKKAAKSVKAKKPRTAAKKTRSTKPKAKKALKIKKTKKVKKAKKAKKATKGKKVSRK